MLGNPNEKSVTLTGADKENVQRLYSEISAALKQLSEIAAKAMGTTLSETNEPVFIPHKHKARSSGVKAEALVFRGTEINCDGKVCYCIDYDAHRVSLC